MASDLENMAKMLLNSPQGSQVLANMDKLRDYMNKPESKQLVSMLAGQGGDAIKKAAAAAADGNQDAAKRMLVSLLSTPEGAQMAKTLLDLIK